VHAWQHLGHFLSSLFGSKEFWAAILGAVFGGLMTGWLALLAQKQAAKDQRKRDRETERETIKGTLQAIETEVELFKVKFLDAFELVFREPDPQTASAPLPKVVSLTQNLSIIFDSNAAVLGRIPDATLRRKIVSTYLKLKAMVDIVNYYAARRESWESIRYQPSPGGGLNELKAEVENWAARIRRNVPELEVEIKDLLVEIRNYLNS
jgi:hypothetical protein